MALDILARPSSLTFACPVRFPIRELRLSNLCGRNAPRVDRCASKKTEGKAEQARGKLRIGDDWNAITIIALSQSSPLKAIAELVENSIDAKARTVTIRAGAKRSNFLAIRDDGEGVPRDRDGRPDFRYVATHICDSVKRRLKADGKPVCKASSGSAC